MGLKLAALRSRVACDTEQARCLQTLNFKSHTKYRASEPAFVVEVALELVKSSKLIKNIRILIYRYFIELHFLHSPSPSQNWAWSYALLWSEKWEGK